MCSIDWFGTQCASANVAAAIAEQEAPAEAELDEMDHDEFAAQELVLPEAPGNPSDESDDEGCGIALRYGWALSRCGSRNCPCAAASVAGADQGVAHQLQCRRSYAALCLLTGSTMR